MWDMSAVIVPLPEADPPDRVTDSHGVKEQPTSAEPTPRNTPENGVPSHVASG